MKKSILSIAVVAAMFSASLFVVSCGSKNKTEQQEQTNDHQHMDGDEMHEGEVFESDTSIVASYACPMHPEVTGKQGDSCSKCGMELELVKVEQ
jgi:hypothetical protein